MVCVVGQVAWRVDWRWANIIGSGQAEAVEAAL